ncbi:hypothetical protein [Rhodopseudomonas sp. RCAM05734]|uniref:hypothetical protein n=1 Tax=Rhodopseudomonas sp. RCAM05734 TaxID=3457549 RepID=UPI004043F642
MSEAELVSISKHRYSATELADLRRASILLARGLPVGADRNQHRQIAVSLRALFSSEKWLEANGLATPTERIP